MALRASLLLVSFALAGMLQASSFTADTFFYVGIYYGSSELFSSGGALLATTQAMTAETQFGCPGPQADQNACGAAIAQSLVQGFSNPTLAGTPPLPPVFSHDFLSQIPTFVDNNGLGNAAPLLATEPPFDPNNTPTPASTALYADLNAPPGNFALTSDTGFVEYGSPLDYPYAFSLQLPIPTEVRDQNGQPVLDQNGQPECCITTFEGVIAVQFFERDLQFTEAVATPEPRWTLLAPVAILMMWLIHRNLRLKACALISLPPAPAAEHRN